MAATAPWRSRRARRIDRAFEAVDHRQQVVAEPLQRKLVRVFHVALAAPANVLDLGLRPQRLIARLFGRRTRGFEGGNQFIDRLRRGLIVSLRPSVSRAPAICLRTCTAKLQAGAASVNGGSISISNPAEARFRAASANQF